MDIKKLYSDLCILVGEIPLYSFLLYCDMFARMLIAKYGSGYALGEGEYSAPESLEDSYAVPDSFYAAALLYIRGQVLSSGELILKSEAEAENAYRTIWRKKAKNKRIKGAAW